MITLNLIGWTLLHSLWQISAIGLILFVSRFFVSSHNAKYVFAFASLLACLFAPLATMVVLEQQDSAVVVVAASSPGVVHASMKLVDSRPGMEQVEISPNSLTLSPESHRSFLELAIPYLTVCWIIGTCLMCLRSLIGFFSFKRLKRESVLTEDSVILGSASYVASKLGIRRQILVKISEQIDVPVVVGFLKSVVILPASFVIKIDADQLDAILAHEFAHIKRFDYVANLAQSVVETLFFFHPVIWWISHVVRDEREFCCGELVEQITGDNRAQVGAFAALKVARSSTPTLSARIVNGSLFSRVGRLALDPNSGPASPWVVAVLSTCLLFGAAHAQKPLDPKLNPPPPKPFIKKVPIEGQVVDAAGKPVKGATVNCVGIFSFTPDQEIRSYVTKEDGRYYFEAISPIVRLVATSETHGFGYRGASLTDSYTIKLSPTHQVTALVVDTEGHAVPGVTIGLRTLHGWPVSPEGLNAVSRLTDSQGVATVTGFPDGETPAATYMNVATSPDKRDVNKRKIKIVLFLPCSVEGKVTLNGQPVPNVIVHASVDKTGYQRESRTDKDGRYRLDNLPQGERVIAAKLPPELEKDYCTAPVVRDFTFEDESLPDYRPRIADFVLTPGARVECSVSGAGSATRVLLTKARSLSVLETSYATQPIPGQESKFVTRVPAGEYTATLYQGTKILKDQKITIRDGDNAKIQF